MAMRYSQLRRYCAWICLVALAALTGCSESYPSLPRLDPGDVVLAFGDSLTYGTGASRGESYPEVLAGLIGRTVVSEGVPGERTAQGLERLSDVLDMHQPRETETNLRRMIDTANARGVGVVLIGVPKPALLGGTARFYERIAEDYAIPYEGEALNEILKDNEYKSDPIHPNARGYRALATALAEVLRRSGAI